MPAKTKHFSFSNISSDTDKANEDEVADADDDEDSKVKPGMMDDSEETEDDSDDSEETEMLFLRNLNDIRRNTAKYVYLLVE